MKILFALALIATSISVQAQTAESKSEATTLTCEIPANNLGVAGQVSVVIDLKKGTVTRDELIFDCDQGVISKEVITKILAEIRVEADNAVKQKRATQVEADEYYKSREAELASVEGTTLYSCPDAAQQEARNYFVSTTAGRNSRYGYSGGTFTGIVSDMTCK